MSTGVFYFFPLSESRVSWSVFSSRNSEEHRWYTVVVYHVLISHYCGGWTKYNLFFSLKWVLIFLIYFKTSFFFLLHHFYLLLLYKPIVLTRSCAVRTANVWGVCRSDKKKKEMIKIQTESWHTVTEKCAGVEEGPSGLGSLERPVKRSTCRLGWAERWSRRTWRGLMVDV